MPVDKYKLDRDDHSEVQHRPDDKKRVFRMSLKNLIAVNAMVSISYTTISYWRPAFNLSIYYFSVSYFRPCRHSPTVLQSTAQPVAIALLLCICVYATPYHPRCHIPPLAK